MAKLVHSDSNGALWDVDSQGILQLMESDALALYQLHYIITRETKDKITVFRQYAMHADIGYVYDGYAAEFMIKNKVLTLQSLSVWKANMEMQPPIVHARCLAEAKIHAPMLFQLAEWAPERPGMTRIYVAQPLTERYNFSIHYTTKGFPCLTH